MKILLSIFLFCLPLAAEEPYQFHGVHFVASYSGCDSEALGNTEVLEQVMREAVIASGATILGEASYLFPPNGLTLVLLLSESHASIHTYPEHHACFVDLFTCGNHCSHDAFDMTLRRYLKPTQIEARVLHRNEGIHDISR